jgi:light-regulated signal transduction histidine kinase (bacteriophytochrome)
MQAAALSILFVEDESEALTCLCTLSAMRYPEAVIHSALDGQSALQSFKLYSPDIVVTDISMPMLDGISMAAEMKALKPEVAIITLTGHMDTRFLLRAIEIGIDHYLLKPLICEKLFSVIDQKIALKNEQFARQQMEIALRKSQNDLRVANLLLEQRVSERTADLQASVRELESFSYSVSHDLRAPLRHINSFSSILIEDYQDELPPPVHSYLERICKASNRMGELIDHLLELSRVGRTQLKPGPVNLSELALSILTGLAETEPERQVEVNIEKDLTVLGDHPLLRQLLENLLGNAWKYTSKKPAARIEFGRTEVSGQPAFFVKDDGAGFDMTYKDNLFVAFQRLHGADFEGNGIGLATAQRIIHRHGGSIWAGGRVNEGATFYFTLPVHF